jgi:hypothetical protein
MTTQLIGDRGIAERLTSKVARDVEQLASAFVFNGVDDTPGVISG